MVTTSFSNLTGVFLLAMIHGDTTMVASMSTRHFRNRDGTFKRRIITFDVLMQRTQVDAVTECWNWTGSIGKKNGYGKICGEVRGVWRRDWLVHRAAQTLFHGPIPEGVLVLHDCDNRRCWNPKHLFLGNHLVNNRQAFSRGHQPIGEAHRSAKLTAKQVRWIRRSKKSSHALAERLPVSSACIRRIRRHLTWKHLCQD